MLLGWLPNLFGEIWIPGAVANELAEGRRKGYEAPDPVDYEWLRVVESENTPSEWLSLDLGAGEIGAMSLGLENPDKTILLDDLLAREIAKEAGLTVWGTLRILLEAKSKGLTNAIEPLIGHLCRKGMWLSDNIRRRVLGLAGE
uniref:DUF3368 domain-containing protein n=1 Tax=Candidatus Kentrum sp. DK TaxID=2126562 RepID=A0A450SKR8_9GAMM|nr:MAG: hypothetical protein BECKDK2373C_GA0170839_104214 [Candidatus Kentron sp. DK]